MNRRESVAHRDGILCLKHLREILGLEPEQSVRLRETDGPIAVAVVVFGGRTRGIAVDRIVRRDGILAKPLDARMARIREFSSAALLGDGTIALVLDPAAMV